MVVLDDERAVLLGLVFYLSMFVCVHICIKAGEDNGSTSLSGCSSERSKRPHPAPLLLGPTPLLPAFAWMQGVRHRAHGLSLAPRVYPTPSLSVGSNSSHSKSKLKFRCASINDVHPLPSIFPFTQPNAHSSTLSL